MLYRDVPGFFIARKIFVVCARAKLAPFILELLAGPEIRTFERHLRIRDHLVAHPASCRDDGRIAEGAEKREFTGGIHIDLASAFQPPNQLLFGFRIFGSCASRVYATEPRRKRAPKIVGLLRGEAP